MAVSALNRRELVGSSESSDIKSVERSGNGSREIEALLRKTIDLKEKYAKKVSSSLAEIQKTFYKDSDGLYTVSRTGEKQIHLNALIGIINYFNDNKEEAGNVLNSIHKQRDKTGHYSLSTSSQDKNQVSDILVSILEFFSGNGEEARRLLRLNGYKTNSGLLTSVNNKYTILSCPNVLNGIAEAMQGNSKKAQKILNALEEKVGKNPFGVLFASSDYKKIHPDVVTVVATLKLFTEGLIKSEEYLNQSPTSQSSTSEGVLFEALHSIISFNILSQKKLI